MSQIDIVVNGRGYAIACDDGQEAHVGKLARYLDQKVVQFTRDLGQVGDARLVIMAALQIIDELVETDQALKQARSAPAARSDSPVSAITLPASVDESIVARTIHDLAAQIENVAARLEAEGDL